MPQKAKELSALSVAKIKETGRHSVGGVDGLCLNVEGNSRVWILRAVVGKRLDKDGNLKPHRRDIGLGPYPEVSLAEARAKATELRLQIRNGIDPIRHKQEQREALLLQQHREKTFRECAKIVIEKKTLELKNEKHIAQWSSSLETYIYPVLGDRVIGSITKADIVTALEPIWIGIHETAKRVRGRIETIFDYAKAMEYFVGDNPAAWKGNLEPILGNLKQESRPHPSLPYEQLAEFIQHLRQKKGISSKALEFAILTACRSGEIFGATWQEIDFVSKVWIIPKERMKAEKEHRVPLSQEALTLLESIKLYTQPQDFIFPAPRGGGMLSDMSLTALIKRMHEQKLNENGLGYIDPKQNRVITTHGFRSTFRDWSADKTDYPREVCEHVLAHKLPDEVEAAYLRGAYLEKRKGLMTDWAEFCSSHFN
ncbi:tyrosine-type recombinase/integrase [Acinetobacter baumannii]|uniref:tyrosine-type recombinase/integrase n=1 Tax=Acinetobacter calcoaceticus/baumannii complex TaxID=909768 RepID=UPI000838EC71|nr:MULTISPECIES: integrase arm-type DNA-binding domain-containing protein [Acinetobacter calcoaceticus/baumannii complex]MDH2526500.1 tyrosine-type recombinase/integrase [Acinetobacter baumannii]MDV7432851.1 tyrosine-type recombinase/integrase [Acinetobacter baumannii]MDV8153886.1 tyrosine-type recombinase/integrase [Acinetobacter pittii]OCY54567.1 integrase [Acinetobacter pittii]HCW3748822.1 tyrosine-type recombinase/integrase [Acinetobacter baumannii]